MWFESILNKYFKQIRANGFLTLAFRMQAVKSKTKFKCFKNAMLYKKKIEKCFSSMSEFELKLKNHHKYTKHQALQNCLVSNQFYIDFVRS